MGFYNGFYNDFYGLREGEAHYLRGMGENNEKEDKYMIKSSIKVKPSRFYHIESVFLQH